MYSVKIMDTSLERKRRNLDLNALFGKRLKLLRKGNHVTQVEVAEAMDFGRPLVSKIEHGQRALDAMELPDYAAAIHVEPEVLFSEIKHIVSEYDSSAAKGRSSTSNQ